MLSHFFLFLCGVWRKFRSLIRTIISTATLLTIFGGRVDDLETILTEERLPDGWESRIREPMGLTMGKFQLTVLGIESRVEGETPIAVRNILS